MDKVHQHINMEMDKYLVMLQYELTLDYESIYMPSSLIQVCLVTFFRFSILCFSDFTVYLNILPPSINRLAVRVTEKILGSESEHKIYMKAHRSPWPF